MPLKKILIVFDNLEISGTHRVALNLIDALTRFNVDCRAIICMQDKIGISQSDERILWHNRRFGTSESLSLKLIKALAAIRDTVRMARDTDVILAVCPPSAVIASLAGWLSGTPVVGWVHYDVEGRKREPLGATSSKFRDWMQNWLYYSFMPSLKNIVFVSNETAHNMVRGCTLKEIPADWRVLPNIYHRSGSLEGSSATRDSVIALKQLGQPVIAFIGRIARQKRWEDAIQAAIELNSLGVEAQWAFIGDGPERGAFLTAISNSPISERLHWLGSDSNPIPTLAIADALALTSLYEAWPTVILEAFDVGVPVISYACPSGPAEMLGRNVRGWLTEENPKALATAIFECFSSRDECQSQSRCMAANKFLKAHTPEVATKAWNEYLESIIMK